MVQNETLWCCFQCQCVLNGAIGIMTSYGSQSSDSCRTSRESDLDDGVLPQCKRHKYYSSYHKRLNNTTLSSLVTCKVNIDSKCYELSLPMEFLQLAIKSATYRSLSNNSWMCINCVCIFVKNEISPFLHHEVGNHDSRTELSFSFNFGTRTRYSHTTAICGCHYLKLISPH